MLIFRFLSLYRTHVLKVIYLYVNIFANITKNLRIGLEAYTLFTGRKHEQYWLKDWLTMNYNEQSITISINSSYQELLQIVLRARGVACPQHDATHDIRLALRSRCLFDSTANEVNRSCTLMLFRQRVAQHDCWADSATQCSEQQNKNKKKEKPNQNA